MKRVSHVYVFTLNSRARRTMRDWTGTSLHALRRCSTVGIGAILREIQVEKDSLDSPAGVAKPERSYSLNRSR